ncbi:hypothetical protein GCM10009096_21490 [Parasphingorhabdus litoris]|uniref:Uncharacterized protein n=1 Tax=Parasphingorhabdus litoris TaxID=394733 RepID=A0ABN1ALM2_9SPHN
MMVGNVSANPNRSAKSPLVIRIAPKLAGIRNVGTRADGEEITTVVDAKRARTAIIQ